MAGLSCAERLLALDPYLDVTVFDTGKYQVGGRCSSRGYPQRPARTNDRPYPILSKSIYDHAAQMIVVEKDPPSHSTDNDNNNVTTVLYTAFRQQLEKWQDDKVIVEFPPGAICSIDYTAASKSGAGGAATVIITPRDNVKAYHGVQGMGAIPAYMAQRLKDVRQDVWVPPNKGVKFATLRQGWFIQPSSNKVGQLGPYDQLVIAHNGKCADRLMSETPATKVHNLLRVNFSPTVPNDGGQKMTLNSIYSLTFALEATNSPFLSQRLPSPFVCGAITGHPVLQFLTCQTRKYPRNDGVEVWTILSTPHFAKRYKAPQEHLPDDVVETVTNKLLTSLQDMLWNNSGSASSSEEEEGPPSSPPLSLLRPLEARLQLWGAAVPLNVYNNHRGFIYDADHHVGVCGDWLVQPSLAGAWTSGRLLADHLLSVQNSSTPPTTAGLDGSFVASAAAQQSGLAAFPTTATATATVPSRQPPIPRRTYTRPKKVIVGDGSNVHKRPTATKEKQ
jgi:predicted NAD/FAD-dependent oxidoreductase